MRRISYLLAVVALVLVSCTPKSYKITGTVEGSMDGDTVYIMKRVNRQFVPMDTAIIANGEFVFTGVQDAAENCYLTYMGEDDMRPIYIDFFIENGNINVSMVRTEGGDVVSGTPINDAYQAFKNNMQVVYNKRSELAQKLQTVAAEDVKAEVEKLNALDGELTAVIKEGINANLSNPLGLFLLNSHNYYMEFDELGDILSNIPENLQNDERVIRLNELVETAKITAVGQKFTDFEMNDTEGNPVKLSDYAGKGKLVLVDCWASWCGPCRNEMPKLVEAYAKYKDKGLEIVGVSLDRAAEPWIKGLEQMNMTWPQMSDLKYWESEVVKLYAIRSIPHVILIDGDGLIISRGLHGDELLAKLDELMQ